MLSLTSVVGEVLATSVEVLSEALVDGALVEVLSVTSVVGEVLITSVAEEVFSTLNVDEAFAIFDSEVP